MINSVTSPWEWKVVWFFCHSFFFSLLLQVIRSLAGDIKGHQITWFPELTFLLTRTASLFFFWLDNLLLLSGKRSGLLSLCSISEYFLRREKARCCHPACYTCPVLHWILQKRLTIPLIELRCICREILLCREFARVISVSYRDDILIAGCGQILSF